LLPENAGMFTEQVFCFHPNSMADTFYVVPRFLLCPLSGILFRRRNHLIFLIAHAGR
jgi:hypothetical protein